MMHLSSSALFTLHVHITLLLSLPRVSLSQEVSLAWGYGACCPLFPVLSNPSWATLPESGSARGFFLFKGSFFFPQLPRARSGRGIGSKKVFQCNLLGSLVRLLFFNWLCIYELH